MNQKGFSSIILAGAVIISIIIGTMGYLLWANKLKPVVIQPTPSPTITPILDETADWKTYGNYDYGFEFKYPAAISLKQNGRNITLSHSIVYKHDDPCDFKGGAPALEKLLDFNVSLAIFNGGLRDAIQSNEGSDYVVKNFFENNTLKLTAGFIDSFTAGSLKGFQIESSAEGCGRITYYFPVSPTKILIVNRSLISEFIPVNADYQTYLNLPAIISPNQEKEFFTKILSTFKFIEKVETADWKTYKDNNHKFSFKYPAGIVVNPSGSNNDVNFYAISIDKSENVSAEGFTLGDVSGASFRLDYHFSGATGSQVAINSSSGKITATYSIGKARGYTYYFYEFQREGKHFLFRMNNYDNKPAFMSASQFKVMVDTISFNENNTNTSAINSTDLLGYWFTPHAATRNIIFLENNQFKFNDGKNQDYTGNFIINESTLTLKFNDNKMKDIILKFSQDNYAKYLQNDEGEYFVKQSKKQA